MFVAFFFGAKFGGMGDKAAAGTTRGMFDMQHFVIQDVFDDKLGNAWAVQITIIGETFQAGTTVTFRAWNWEKVRVPAGEFVSLKVIATLSYILMNNEGQTNRGTGTWTYWIASGTNCLVRHEYSDSFGDKSSWQLLSFKH